MKKLILIMSFILLFTGCSNINYKSEGSPSTQLENPTSSDEQAESSKSERMERDDFNHKSDKRYKDKKRDKDFKIPKENERTLTWNDIYKDQEFLSDTGEIKAINSHAIVVTTLSGQELQLNSSENTILYDASSYSKTKFEDFKVGDSVKFYYSPVMTRSLPPQSNAIAVFNNFDMINNVNLTFVSNIQNNKITDDTLAVILTIQDEASIQSFDSEEEISINDISEGDIVLAYYNFVALSYPAQASTEKAIVVKYNGSDTINVRPNRPEPRIVNSRDEGDAIRLEG